MSPANLDLPFELHKLLPAPSNVPLRFIVDPVRLRFIGEGGIKTNWVRPGVHCDGNPENLSQPMTRSRAALVARVAPKLWQVEEIDAHALPLDAELRGRYIAWLSERYSVQVPDDLREPPVEGETEADAAADAPPASADAPPQSESDAAPAATAPADEGQGATSPADTSPAETAPKDSQSGGRSGGRRRAGSS